MGPGCGERVWHTSFHPISCGKARHLFVSHLVATRKAFLRPECAAMIPSARCCDTERFELAHLHACKLPHTQSVFGMALLDPESGSIPPRSSARPGADGQTKDTQGFYQLVPDGVDGCRIFERSLHGSLARCGLVQRDNSSCRNRRSGTGTYAADKP